jgi:hypothetical protein
VRADRIEEAGRASRETERRNTMVAIEVLIRRGAARVYVAEERYVELTHSMSALLVDPGSYGGR